MQLNKRYENINTCTNSTIITIVWFDHFFNMTCSNHSWVFYQWFRIYNKLRIFFSAYYYTLKFTFLNSKYLLNYYIDKKLLHNINLYCKSSTQTRNTNVCMLNVEIFVFQRQFLLKCPYIKLYSFWVTNERQKSRGYRFYIEYSKCENACKYFDLISMYSHYLLQRQVRYLINDHWKKKFRKNDWHGTLLLK